MKRVTVVNNVDGFAKEILVENDATAKDALETNGITVEGTSMAVTVNGAEVGWDTEVEEGDTIGYVPKKLGGHS